MRSSVIIMQWLHVVKLKWLQIPASTLKAVNKNSNAITDLRERSDSILSTDNNLLRTAWH